MCELSTKEISWEKAAEDFEVPIKSTRQIYILLLIPTFVSFFVYIAHFAADFVVAVQHFKEHNPVWGYVTIGFMYAPAVAYFILTVSRPDWWMTDEDKLHKGIFLWFLLQVSKLIAFPLFALYRYASLIVLSVDAIRYTGEERRKALKILAAPAAIELYFFLQAWFQATPQVLFQTHLFFKEKIFFHTCQSEVVHGSCIIISICVVAIKTTSFQRYETQRTIGRKVPWAMWLKKSRVQELENFEDKQLIQSKASSTNAETISSNKNDIDEKTHSNTVPHSNLERQNSTTPPLPPKNVKIIPPPTPLRGITSITPLAVPDEPAPQRPDESKINSEEVTAEEILNKSIDDSEVSKAIERHSSIKTAKQNFFLSRTEYAFFEKISCFIWWFLFILARVLSITIFFEFYPTLLLVIVSLNYVCVISYLFYYAKYNDITSFFINIWLGFVYMFSIIEYRVKFKHAYKWLVFYYMFVFLQNIFMTFTWYYYGTWNGFWWYSYSFNIIFVCISLCLLSTIIYYIFLKLKRRRVYYT